ncbi:NAD(P)/FAD-dependent oxidoreductase [Frigidibacter sp. MR17.24]|uniref:NAD(P)/FAD-dependent oxidoreductase n=1 Tax=Frigidibacter sp. MR17.24 TaxID=3127345 RepID=UPI003012BCA4
MRFPITADSPVEHDGPLPDAVDVAVIGGGVAGVSTALFLARAGRRVALLEKGRIAGEQSSRNWGWVRQQGRDPAELPIVVEALRHWEALNAETNDALGFRREGIVYIARTGAEMAAYEAWLPHARAHGVDSRLISRRELAALMPNAPGWHGGLYTPSDARAEPWVAVPVLARLAAAAGVQIREGCAVRRLETAGGRVTGVLTERGRIGAERVVLAGGAWSGMLARAHGVVLPQLSVRATVGVTQELPEVFAGAASDGRVAWRRRRDGRYTLASGPLHDFYIGPDAFRHLRAFVPQIRADLSGTHFNLAAPKGFPDAWGTPRALHADRPTPFEAMRVLNPTPNPAFAARFRTAFAEAFPSLGEIRLDLAWAGMIDAMPDVVPALGEAPGLAGLIVATGLSGHGFGIGPGVGRVIADIAMGRPAGHEMSRFRLSRFTDGSPVVLGPTL